MPDDNFADDTEIIRAAYAEKVKEAFKVFAENLGMGQNEKSSKDRFSRSLELVRKARDMALEVSSGVVVVEPTAAAAKILADSEPNAADSLSLEDQAMIQQALAGTTGLKPVTRR